MVEEAAVQEGKTWQVYYFWTKKKKKKRERGERERETSRGWIWWSPEFCCCCFLYCDILAFQYKISSQRIKTVWLYWKSDCFLLQRSVPKALTDLFNRTEDIFWNSEPCNFWASHHKQQKQYHKGSFHLLAYIVVVHTWSSTITFAATG